MNIVPRTALAAFVAAVMLTGCAAADTATASGATPGVCLDALDLADEALLQAADAMDAGGAGIDAIERYYAAPLGSSAETQALAGVDDATARISAVADWMDDHAGEKHDLFESCRSAS
ncbi:MAG: hypothetical protein GEU78_18420 [Actinobacteria bacterium]|nr:hypothetical protein [Actinomycetota bacterium]